MAYGWGCCETSCPRSTIRHGADAVPSRFALEDTITAIGQQDKLLPIDWSVPEQPLDKLERLRETSPRRLAQTADAAVAQGYLFCASVPSPACSATWT